MNCPECNNSTKVIESRESSNSIRRRRECISCNERFTTHEKIHITSITVVKRDWTKEDFSIEKIEKSIRIACTKRPIKELAISKLIFDVGKEVFSLNQANVESKKIGEIVINKLKKLDDVSYLRFASVYKDFKNLSYFENELNDLSKKKQ
ncbi:MAG: transcriptional repressor NrdR [Chloroflexi bacterium]|nr:transcriptional repressor NrdR [Chloroflexota bacterium]|tara:strand:+ start:347 stop:796 length:450 start_codon:yes stop_codon:yes gene_type:complete